MAAGIEVTEETLAVDVIKKVGIGGHFLAEKHTRRHMRNIWQPKLFDRAPYDAWEAGGKKGALQKATEKAKWIPANHAPTPLEPDLQKELRKIIRAAQEELMG